MIAASPLLRRTDHHCDGRCRRRWRAFHRTSLLATALLAACHFLAGDPSGAGWAVRAFAGPAAGRRHGGSAPAIVAGSRRRSPATTCLAMGTTASTSRIGVSVPSQSKCEALGVREWPQQSKTGTWTEGVSPEASVQRYILEGSGKLSVVVDDSGDATAIALKPGTLVEIGVGTPSVTLEWECGPNCPEIILLTPGFEEGNVFLGVIAGIVVLFGVLLSGALG